MPLAHLRRGREAAARASSLHLLQVTVYKVDRRETGRRLLGSSVGCTAHAALLNARCVARAIAARVTGKPVQLPSQRALLAELRRPCCALIRAHERMSDAGRALFAPLQRRQVGAVLALALERCLQIKTSAITPRFQLAAYAMRACHAHAPHL